MNDYTTRCRFCQFHAAGGSGVVSSAASEHERSTGHRVQVWPTAAIVCPLPRSMWADEVRG